MSRWIGYSSVMIEGLLVLCYHLKLFKDLESVLIEGLFDMSSEVFNMCLGVYVPQFVWSCNISSCEIKMMVVV